MQFTNRATLIWSIVELLRGNCKQADYGKVILPFTLLRRPDPVLAPTKQAVLDAATCPRVEGIPVEPFLLRASRQSIYNTSPYDFDERKCNRRHDRRGGQRGRTTERRPSYPLDTLMTWRAIEAER